MEEVKTTELPDFVTITREEYNELLERDDILSRLEAAGVDNWEWYGDALRDEGKEKEEEA